MSGPTPATSDAAPTPPAPISGVFVIDSPSPRRVYARKTLFPTEPPTPGTLRWNPRNLPYPHAPARLDTRSRPSSPSASSFLPSPAGAWNAIRPDRLPHRRPPPEPPRPRLPPPKPPPPGPHGPHRRERGDGRPPASPSPRGAYKDAETETAPTKGRSPARPAPRGTRRDARSPSRHRSGFSLLAMERLKPGAIPRTVGP